MIRRERFRRSRLVEQVTLVQIAYVNEDAIEVLIVRLLPNAEAMDLYLHGTDERSRAVYKFIETDSIKIYSVPNKDAMEIVNRIAGSGIDVSVKSQFIGDIIRPRSW